MSSAFFDVDGARERSRTWPLSTTEHRQVNSRITSASEGSARRALIETRQPSHDSVEDYDDIDANPEKHFLSPVHTYEYEDWSDDSDIDSDDDADHVAWDAGITDFALFDDERRLAEQEGAPLPRRWDALVASQSSALKRSVDRAQTLSHLEPASAADQDRHQLPALTPDNSPDLRDDFDDVEQPPQPLLRRRPSFGGYRLPRVILTPPKDADLALDDDKSAYHGDEDGIMLSARRVERVTARVRRNRPRPWIQRPGLSLNRTLSGHWHSWDRPSRHITTVYEEAEEDVMAEEECMSNSWAGGEGPRGRAVNRPVIQRCHTSRL